MQTIKCSKCGEMISIDNSVYEKALNLMGERLLEKEAIIKDLREELELCHKKLMDVNKEDSRVENLTTKTVEIDIVNKEELHFNVSILDNLRMELIKKKKEILETHQLIASGDESKIEELNNLYNQVEILSEEIAKKEEDIILLVHK